MLGLMVSSSAQSVEQYLAELPEARAEVVSAVRKLLLENLPSGLEETMNWGMISYEVPLSVVPNTYNKQPLMFAALAAQKHHYSIYLSSIYAIEEVRAKFEADYLASGKRYDVGKGCIRFRKLDDLPMDVVAKAVASVSMQEFIAAYEGLRKN